MASRNSNQEERLLKIEHSLLTMNSAIQKSQSLTLGIQAEQRRSEALVTQHEYIIPRLNHEVEISSQRVNTVLSPVEERMRDFEVINKVKQSNMNMEVPGEIVNSLNDIIMEGAPSTISEVIRQRVAELFQVVHTDLFNTDSLRDVMLDLQERFDATLQHTVGSSIPSYGDPSLQTSDRQMNEMRSSQRYTCSKEREIVMKGVERNRFFNTLMFTYPVNKLTSLCERSVKLLMSQLLILQLIGNIQKALQK